MTRKSLAFAINRFEKGNRANEWILVSILFAGLIGLFVFLSRFPDALARATVGWAFCCVIALWIVGVLYFLGRVNRARIKQLNLRCPSCNVSLVGFFGRLAVATTYCGHCGEKIVEEEKNRTNLSD